MPDTLDEIRNWQHERLPMSEIVQYFLKRAQTVRRRQDATITAIASRYRTMISCQSCGALGYDWQFRCFSCQTPTRYIHEEQFDAGERKTSD